MSSFTITSPVDGSKVAEIRYTDNDELEELLHQAREAQQKWARLSVEQRVDILRRGVAALLAEKRRLGTELTMLMGRPIRYAEDELSGFELRATYLLDIAAKQLQVDTIGEGLEIVKEPVGIVLIIGAWNYPYLVVVNTLIPALAAGNAVLLKHASQTALVGDNIMNAFMKAGLPAGILHSIHLTNDRSEALTTHPLVNYVSLVGSVGAGQAIQKSMATRTKDFAKVSLELGGCDAAYVRPDANLEKTAHELAEGAFFNSGQSCCGVQRIFVQESIFQEFSTIWKDAAQSWKLGDPRDQNTTLGPLVSIDAAKRVIETTKSNYDSENVLRLPGGTGTGLAYVPPTIYFNPAPDSAILHEEVFGPVAAICSVRDDAEAISRINETSYGLTASIWTMDRSWVPSHAHLINVGTVYANRCDSLHPGLPWGGVKLSGLGFSLSKYAYDQVTRPKALNYHYD
jgi:acyl-CoA reductase-like NAD-dependent aldehyde dehydrogenase